MRKFNNSTLGWGFSPQRFGLWGLGKARESFVGSLGYLACLARPCTSRVKVLENEGKLETETNRQEKDRKKRNWLVVWSQIMVTGGEPNLKIVTAASCELALPLGTRIKEPNLKMFMAATCELFLK